jgi:hypothetical protein
LLRNVSFRSLTALSCSWRSLVRSFLRDRKASRFNVVFVFFVLFFFVALRRLKNSSQNIFFKLIWRVEVIGEGGAR